MKDTPHFGKTMTVRELVDALEVFGDPDLPVITEGCDCYGAAFAVEIQDDRLLIIRDPEVH